MFLFEVKSFKKWKKPVSFVHVLLDSRMHFCWVSDNYVTWRSKSPDKAERCAGLNVGLLGTRFFCVRCLYPNPFMDALRCHECRINTPVITAYLDQKVFHGVPYPAFWRNYRNSTHMKYNVFRNKHCPTTDLEWIC